MERDADRYTLIPTADLRDPGLTWAEKGLLAYLRAHPDTAGLTVGRIAADRVDDVRAVSAALLGLHAKGFLDVHPGAGLDGALWGDEGGE